MLDLTTNDAFNEDSSAPPYYVGEVVAVNDPNDLNRIKVRIPGKIEGPVESLPWLAPMRLSPFGQGKGFGVYGTPPVGSHVLVELQNDLANYGFYVAGFFSLECANPNFNSPDLWGFQDPSGSLLVVNLATKIWTFHHVSGLTYTYDQDGNYTSVIPGNRTETIQQGSTSDIAQDWLVKVGGSVLIQSQVATIQAETANLDAAETNVSGNLNVDGVITGKSGMNISGNNGSGSTMTMKGNLEHTDGYIKSNNVIVHTHEHPNGNGGSPTGSPTPGT